MTEQTSEHYRDLLDRFNTAMLVSLNPAGPVSRPMVIAAKYSDDELGFICDGRSALAGELRANATANVTLQSEDQFMSIVGAATLVDDRAELERLWQPGWQAWFPNGKDDPNLQLIRFKADAAEYWDLSGFNQLRFLYEAGKAMVSSHSDADREPLHGSVELRRPGSSEAAR